MKNAYLLGLGEIALSLGAGYYFAGGKWDIGAALLFIALLILLRSEPRIKKEDLELVRAKDRFSDAFILAGITLGLADHYRVYGALALFGALVLPQVAGRAREFRGGVNRDIARKYRLIVMIFAGAVQALYPAAAAMVLGLGAVTLAVVFDFLGALKGISRKKPKRT